MTRIVGVHGVLPSHHYEQHEITDALAEMCLPSGTDRGVLERLHASATVRSRHLALPLDRYRDLGGFGAANDAFIEVALELGEQAVLGALERAGLRPEDVDLVISTSVTGIAAPSLEARLAARVGLRPDVRRLPVFGLGCVAGAVGLARLHDFLEGRPRGVALLLCVELCSLTMQRADASVQNLIAGSLFGDGVAAAVAVGGDAPAASGPAAPAVVATRGRLYPGTERTLGFDVTDTGFRIVLGAELPDLIRLHLGAEVESFLGDHDLKVSDVAAWICHPGGPKVLDAVREALGLPPRALDLARRSLARVGNLSSASVLHILRDTLDLQPPPPGSAGLLLGMGPGFCTELVLLRW